MLPYPRAVSARVVPSAGAESQQNSVQLYKQGANCSAEQLLSYIQGAETHGLRMSVALIDMSEACGCRQSEQPAVMSGMHPDVNVTVWRCELRFPREHLNFSQGAWLLIQQLRHDSYSTHVVLSEI